MNPLIDRDSAVSNPDRDNDHTPDCWQPFGAVARRLVRRLGLPPATGIQVLEQAGVHLEVAE